MKNGIKITDLSSRLVCLSASAHGLIGDERRTGRHAWLLIVRDRVNFERAG
jgi:hypothetical protein